VTGGEPRQDHGRPGPLSAVRAVGLRTRVIGGVGLTTGLGAAAYLLLLRRRCLTWGATRDEVARPLPGDDLLATPDMVSTRAVTIDAPPSAIWPWLVQMGSDRGGAYTYDWIENLFGLNMHSASTVLPELQDVKVGDAFPLGQGGPQLHVEILDPEHSLVFRFDGANWIWSFNLEPENGSARLVSRNRIATPNASAAKRAVNALLMEPGSLVMERKMLKGIKQRAEKLAHQTTVGVAEE
jgi:hypothetical protein